MGFPLGYSELLLPKLIFQAFSFLGLIQNLFSYIFSLLGLTHLLETDPSTPDHTTHQPQPQSLSAVLLREILPVIKFQELLQESDAPDRCAVCLYEFEGHQEIRRLTNCRHIFHRTCLDPWLDHDHKTCPLCRTLFVPEPLREDFNERLWAAAGVPDFYGEYSSQSPTWES